MGLSVFLRGNLGPSRQSTVVMLTYAIHLLCPTIIGCLIQFHTNNDVRIILTPFFPYRVGCEVFYLLSIHGWEFDNTHLLTKSNIS
ncbi:hypothetical protein BT96DRAFT_923857 [Gymnopus androsaceus JB14]|uniref:Uncharacterized protein n=1 Tax=Gymnopus androsaceus JB14 TaxID=1447944 RepID=A0A6A4H7R3_9AGAR|nr:hypothetical protein BT96DRAFT_923857 [Gymnopus androsaceus JB14]